MNDPLTNTCHATIRLVEMNSQLTNACRTTIRLIKIDQMMYPTLSRQL